MKKSRFISTIMALFLAVSMCVSFSATAFAAEESTPEDPVDVAGAVGQILYAEGKDFNGETTITINMTSGNWAADFLVGVIGDAGTTYKVVLEAANGNKYISYVSGNNSTLTKIITLTYAKAGTYKFTFTKLGAGNSSAHALVEICD